MFGMAHAPQRIDAADVSLEGIPSSVRPGGLLRLRLSLGSHHATQSAEELEVSLGMLAESTQVEATLEGILEGHELPLLQVIVAPDVDLRCLHICVDVPPYPNGPTTAVRISIVSITGHLAWGPDFTVPVHEGIAAPLVLEPERPGHPCISREGLVYCPSRGDEGVLVFDSDGAALAGISVESLGLSNCYLVAHADIEIPALLLFDISNRVVALDPTTRTVFWSGSICGDASHYSYCHCTVIPSMGVFVVSCRGALLIFRLSDGCRVGGLLVPDLHDSLASDIHTGAVFASVSTASAEDDDDGWGVSVLVSVSAWTCSADAAGGNLCAAGPVTAAGSDFEGRSLVVVPPASGKNVSHLVVGTLGTPRLLVLSLPDLILVHTHSLVGMGVLGLAADPWGRALAVRESSSSIHVLAWPLPGMPEVE